VITLDFVYFTVFGFPTPKVPSVSGNSRAGWVVRIFFFSTTTIHHYAVVLFQTFLIGVGHNGSRQGSFELFKRY